ncbi:MAG: glycosyltransferase family 2 protein [Anaerolineae bacterium]|nr:glycosyltransferase family 2 protein [Anaerolineae bacterium]
MVLPAVSVIIKTYDNTHGNTCATSFPTLKELLGDTLTALAKQTHLPREVLVVDSSAGDGIAQVLQVTSQSHVLNIRHIPLPPAEFSYPHALNLGIQHADGDIVISLSGDATPANPRWLETLIAPLADPKVGGSFSRHIPRPAVPLAWAERFRLWWRYRSRETTIRYTDHIFSNASSAFPRALALEVPFDETLTELEDYAWAGEVQSQGYGIAYVGESEVYHCHTTASLKTLWRMLYYVYLRMKADTGGQTSNVKRQI